ncbi:hypothetical protein C8J56DRAFT_899251 [Mycena floridula]|nr:hypothetical protein C8J56DRAFT_899251 [Mycena floridula]
MARTQTVMKIEVIRHLSWSPPKVPANEMSELAPKLSWVSKALKMDEVGLENNGILRRYYGHIPTNEMSELAPKLSDDYDGSGPSWKERTLGVGLFVNHSSETQLQGLKSRLAEISQTFKSSPLAKREQVSFVPDDFAFKLFGANGDHAADQKKNSRMLESWKTMVVDRKMGEEALLDMEVGPMLEALSISKGKKIQEAGREVKWNSLTAEQRLVIEEEILRDFGRAHIETLPPDE